jgi:hypothetical protein
MATSKLQRQVSMLLNTHLGQYTIRENHRPDWLDGLELDFYIEELQVGIEVQGIQHYEYTPWFHGNYEAFLAQKDRDERKSNLCQAQCVSLFYISSMSDKAYLLDKILSLVTEETYSQQRNREQGAIMLEALQSLYDEIKAGRHKGHPRQSRTLKALRKQMSRF